jgi:transaldolase
MGPSGEPHLDFTSFEAFEKLHGADRMAVEMLADGVDRFAKDQEKLEAMIAKLAN